ncbi:MAG: C1 family peptidase [Spirochaetales bacterium]|nr:C1 family peptidase [Spirochaetales bacterium]
MKQLKFFIIPLLVCTFFFSCGDLSSALDEDTTDGTTDTVSDTSSDAPFFPTTPDDSSDELSVEGAFKFVNSWGDYYTVWENVLDGHYWVEYEDMIANGFYIYYYYNDDSEIYDPTAIALMEVDHDSRDEVSITVGIQNSRGDSLYSKTLECAYGNYLYGGDEPFPDNVMALDITEFADYLDDYDLYLTASNSGRTEGTIESFSLELYNGYDNSGETTVQTFTYDEGEVSLPASSSVTLELETADNVDDSWDTSSSSSSTSSDPAFTFRALTMSEISGLLTEDKQLFSPREIVMDKFGTGWSAPTVEEWEKVSFLDTAETTISRSGTYDDVDLPDEVDLSDSDYFPPVGNQGSEGSCACFSTVYYMQTYMEAREHDWDLSSVTWNQSSDTSDGGEPDSMLENIFSPDFIYHQINMGGDNGSSTYLALETLIREGCATWDTMPYDTTDSTSWAEEEGWRDAAQYRSDTDSYYTGNSYSNIGFFYMDDEDDILFLKYLLSEGYPVSTAIYGGSSTDYGLYDELDENDVMENGNTWSSSYWNHAQTIVGYKEGDEWDSSNPED